MGTNVSPCLRRVDHAVHPVHHAHAAAQGLTLVHFSAQRKRFLWYGGCVEGLFRGTLGGVMGVTQCFRVCFGGRHGLV
jgi:hypothetical protein